MPVGLFVDDFGSEDRPIDPPLFLLSDERRGDSGLRRRRELVGGFLDGRFVGFLADGFEIVDGLLHLIAGQFVDRDPLFIVLSDFSVSVPWNR